MASRCVSAANNEGRLENRRDNHNSDADALSRRSFCGMLSGMFRISPHHLTASLRRSSCFLRSSVSATETDVAINGAANQHLIRLTHDCFLRILGNICNFFLDFIQPFCGPFYPAARSRPYVPIVHVFPRPISSCGEPIHALDYFGGKLGGNLRWLRYSAALFHTPNGVQEYT